MEISEKIAVTLSFIGFISFIFIHSFHCPLKHNNVGQIESSFVISLFLHYRDFWLNRESSSERISNSNISEFNAF